MRKMISSVTFEIPLFHHRSRGSKNDVKVFMMLNETASREAEDFQKAVYRRMSPSERLQSAYQLYVLAKEMIRLREQRLHPELSARELELRVRSFFA